MQPPYNSFQEDRNLLGIYLNKVCGWRSVHGRESVIHLCINTEMRGPSRIIKTSASNVDR